MNTSGKNTAMVVSVELSIGVMTSDVPLMQASSSESPRPRYWAMFSVTMMELSIYVPAWATKFTIIIVLVLVDTNLDHSGLKNVQNSKIRSHKTVKFMTFSFAFFLIVIEWF